MPQYLRAERERGTRRDESIHCPPELTGAGDSKSVVVGHQDQCYVSRVPGSFPFTVLLERETMLARVRVQEVTLAESKRWSKHGEEPGKTSYPIRVREEEHDSLIDANIRQRLSYGDVQRPRPTKERSTTTVPRAVEEQGHLLQHIRR
jgi:hypothetical protein